MACASAWPCVATTMVAFMNAANCCVKLIVSRRTTVVSTTSETVSTTSFKFDMRRAP